MRPSASSLASALALAVAMSVPARAAAAAAENPAPAPPSDPSADAAAASADATDGRFGEEIVVTATRTPRPARDVPATVSVLLRPDIERTPAKTVDELLRVVPSFGLFRRSSSAAADPSSQGVNLRGIGPSGVSRSLVLMDGVPVNDPYGGWVYWRGISRLDTDRIEVVPGGGSALYGNYALGGVTQVFSRPITGRSVEASTEYGSFGTYLASARAADRFGAVGAAIDAELLKSGGYAVVAPDKRGAVDGDAPSQHIVVNGRLEAAPTPDLSFTLRGGWFRETENGGTDFTTAGVKRFGYAGTARYTPADAGALDLAVFGHAPTFEQQRARIPDPVARSQAFLAESQVVPAHDVGAGLRYTAPPLALAGTHTLTLGTDARRITGALHDALFPTLPTRANQLVTVGRENDGEQRLYGLFAQEAYDVTSALSLNLAVRWDRWQNFDATEVDSSADRFGVITAKTVTMHGRSDEQVSPKLGVRVRPLDWLTLRGSAYRAFRAPSLNELYRPFQVGLVVTQGNPNLGPEKLDGAEAGVEISPTRTFTTRATGFWNLLHDPIVNVTCSGPTASLCATTGANLQQRLNLGRAIVRGVEADVAWRPARAWLASVGYTFVDSQVTRAPTAAQVGKDLPQDPRHRATASLTFDDPHLLTAMAQLRYVGRQFEDDQNLKGLPAAVVFDVSLSRRLGSNIDAVLGIENVFDAQYLVGRAGVDTVGQPRFVHGGLRLHYGG